MNTSIYTSALERTRFSPDRGASMAAQHASGQAILNAVGDGRSCTALGLCQSRKPACADCSVPCIRFAPGAIEYGAQRPKPKGQFGLLLLLAICFALFFAAPLIAGFIVRWAGWL